MKKSLNKYIRIAFLGLTMLFTINCAGDNPVSADNQMASVEKTVQSDRGDITILQTDPEIQNVYNTYQDKTNLFKYTDIEQYFVEGFVESDKDETIKLGDGSTGESKVEFKKFNLTSSMTVFFEWAADDETYTGIIDNRENADVGLTFNDSVYIELSYKMAYLGDVDESSISLYMYNANTASWDEIAGEIDYGNKRVESYINRFGKLALFHIKNGQPETLYKVQDVQYYASAFIEADDHEKIEVDGEELDKSYVDIEAYDLPQDMTVTFEWAADKHFKGLINSVEYGTNVVLNNPVAVRVSYKNARLIGVNDESTVALYLFNSEIEDWEKLDGITDQDDKIVDAYITRFGEIALFYEEDGILFDMVKLGENVFYAKKHIKKSHGGGIELGNGSVGKTKIKFKKHDLPEDSEIKFEWAAGGTMEGLLDDLVFGPHGTHFNSPVEVTLSYKIANIEGIPEEELAVYYYNEEEDLWEYIGGTVDIGKKKITVFLNHFSRYAVAYAR